MIDGRPYHFFHPRRHRLRELRRLGDGIARRPAIKGESGERVVLCDEILSRLFGDRGRALFTLRDEPLYETGRELAIRLHERRWRLRRKRRHLGPALQSRSAAAFTCEELRYMLDK